LTAMSRMMTSTEDWNTFQSSNTSNG
jgi:hypothetical protein